MSDKILKEALLAKDLVLDNDTKFRDARSNIAVPSDFGEHEDIPEDEIGCTAVDTSCRKLKAGPTLELEMIKVRDIEEAYHIDFGSMAPSEALEFISKIKDKYDRQCKWGEFFNKTGEK